MPMRRQGGPVPQLIPGRRAKGGGGVGTARQPGREAGRARALPSAEADGARTRRVPLGSGAGRCAAPRQGTRGSRFAASPELRGRVGGASSQTVEERGGGGGPHRREGARRILGGEGGDPPGQRPGWRKDQGEASGGSGSGVQWGGRADGWPDGGVPGATSYEARASMYSRFVPLGIQQTYDAGMHVYLGGSGEAEAAARAAVGQVRAQGMDAWRGEAGQASGQAGGPVPVRRRDPPPRSCRRACAASATPPTWPCTGSPSSPSSASPRPCSAAATSGAPSPCGPPSAPRGWTPETQGRAHGAHGRPLRRTLVHGLARRRPTMGRKEGWGARV